MLRKITIVVFVTLSSLFLYISNTQASWTIHDNNPILRGSPDSWDSRDVQNGKIIKENSSLSMWYSGNDSSGWKIGLASSENGTDWAKHNGPILVNAELWGKEVNDPVLIKENGNYKIWFSLLGDGNLGSGADRFRVGYGTSPDGINWDLYDGWVLTGTSGNWDSGGIARGLSVMKQEDTYKMWYAGVNEAAMGSAEEKWQIGYATSPDGIIWTKHPDNPVITPVEDWELNSVSYPHVIFEGGFYHMWYAATNIDLPVQIIYAYSEDGINWIKPADKNPALTTGEHGYFDSNNVASPFVIKDDDLLRMWYSGYDGSRWSIGYAEEEAALPTPSPTPSPIPTPIPSEPTDKIIFLPGLGASWNHTGMLFGMDKPSSEWQMTPGVKIYDGLFKTLESAGYSREEDQNLFVFNYNWTQPISKTVLELKHFINQINLKTGEKIDLVGHSMGGVVARSCAQLNPELPIDQVVTLGSPHQGVPHLYFAWEGGQAGNSMRGWPLWQRVGIGLILMLRRDKFESPVETVQKVAPGIKDLLPTFDYLKKENGTVKNISTMNERNNWLENLNNALPDSLLEKLYPFAAVTNPPESTLHWIEVKPANWFEKLLGLWIDGRPTGIEEYQPGDNTVLKESAQIVGSNIVDINGIDHVDLVTDKNSIDRICQTLGLNPTEITGGEKQVEPSLLFLLGSPAQMEVVTPTGEKLHNDSNFILIEQPDDGDYQINLLGTGNGQYNLYSLFIGSEESSWQQISGLINSGQEKNHQSRLGNNHISIIDTNGQQYQDSANAKLLQLEKEINNLIFKPGLKFPLKYLINNTKWLIRKNKMERAMINLFQAHYLLSYWQAKGLETAETTVFLRHRTLSVVDDLLATADNQAYLKTKLAAERRLTQKYLNLTGKSLAVSTRKQSIHAAIYQQAKESFEKGKQTANLTAHLHLLSSRILSQQSIALLY